ncbi:hypothetical protein H4Q26_004969 [Puccinia striiformis f. sp. tritici PST-130]|nr:hypothetical protein H4Q26_004969 [Puccinia striiformis f. sp. tritici PST-130]
MEDPSFTSDGDALDYFRSLARSLQLDLDDTKSALDEFQLSSKSWRPNWSRTPGYRKQLKELRGKEDIFCTKSISGKSSIILPSGSHKDYDHMQTELETCRKSNEEYRTRLRDMELDNDELEAKKGNLAKPPDCQPIRTFSQTPLSDLDQGHLHVTDARDSPRRRLSSAAADSPSYKRKAITITQLKKGGSLRGNLTRLLRPPTAHIISHPISPGRYNYRSPKPNALNLEADRLSGPTNTVIGVLIYIPSSRDGATAASTTNHITLVVQEDYLRYHFYCFKNVTQPPTSQDKDHQDTGQSVSSIPILNHHHLSSKKSKITNLHHHTSIIKIIISSELNPNLSTIQISSSQTIDILNLLLYYTTTTTTSKSKSILLVAES